MITHSTRIQDNKCYITFDLTPKDVRCSRGNYTATHKGGSGTTERYGIWEGIELVEARIKVGDKPWVSYDTQTSITIALSDNNVRVQAEGRYSLKTMGYHFQCTNGTYPFFYYGNYSGVASKYSYGYFTDSYPAVPKSQLYEIHAMVPKDWTHTQTRWSDWAYKHGQATSNWAYDNGRYEQRNANYESANSSNGWISDSGYKQIYRKSCAFYFQKTFSDSVVTSGVVKDASTPEITVHPAKGNQGKVTLRYVDRNNSPGKFWLRAYCNGKQVDIDNYASSGTFSNGGSWTYTVNFDDWFGHAYEGNDVTYQAWAKNSYDKESPGTGIKGGHRYNGRPSIPNGLFVSGKNDILYNTITFKWNPSTDPDGDSVSYDLWLRVIGPNGNKLKDQIIVNRHNGTTCDYDISSDPDNSSYEFWVRGSDGLINSDWSQPLSFKKGAKPTGTIVLISPVIDGTNIHSTNPRLAFKGYDGESMFIVSINNEEFNSSTNPDLFNIENKTVMFVVPDKFSNANSLAISAYMQNKYGRSEVSRTYMFRKFFPESDIGESKIIKAYLVEDLRSLIIDKGKAYKKDFSFTPIIPKETIVTAEIYNEHVDALKAINDDINSIINNDRFDRIMHSQRVTSSSQTIIDDQLWKNLILDLKNI